MNKKIPRGPPSPPAHSPTRKVTMKEQQDWKIPPCVSNLKRTTRVTLYHWIRGLLLMVEDLLTTLSKQYFQNNANFSSVK